MVGQEIRGNHVEYTQRHIAIDPKNSGKQQKLD
jgi:hypothetical protein